MDKNMSIKPDVRRTEGVGAIFGIVAVAVLIVVGMIYILQPLGDAPARVTSEAPDATTPAPSK